MAFPTQQKTGLHIQQVLLTLFQTIRANGTIPMTMAMVITWSISTVKPFGTPTEATDARQLKGPQHSTDGAAPTPIKTVGLTPQAHGLQVLAVVAMHGRWTPLSGTTLMVMGEVITLEAQLRMSAPIKQGPQSAPPPAATDGVVLTQMATVGLI
jgi:hypothetical protein